MKRAEKKRNVLPTRIGGMEKMIKAELQKEVKAQAASIVRPVGRPKGRTAFQSVVKAREILAQSSVMAARLISKAAKVAAARGDSAPAEFLLKHTGAQDDKGKMVRPLVTSVDKLESDTGPRMPTINIGWIPQQPALAPAQVIDVRALPAHDDS